MDDIIKKLNELKMPIASGRTTTEHVDKLNDIIASCKKKREEYEAILNSAAVMPEEEFVSFPEGKFLFNGCTVNFYMNPPTLAE